MSLQIKNLSYLIGNKKIIDALDLTLEKGKLYGLLAPNGSGKTTLLKLIARLISPSSGTISYNQTPTSSLSRLELSRIFTLIPQLPYTAFNFTAYQMVAMGTYASLLSQKQKEENIENALQTVDGWNFRNHFLDQLSGGERQRVYIARALASQAPFLLLDEPFTYLDLRYQLELIALIKKLHNQGKTLILALHDFRIAEEICEDLILLKDGKLLFQGSPEALFSSNCFEEAFGIKRLGHHSYDLMEKRIDIDKAALLQNNK